ncbi:MAG: Ig-like domain repeat protein [Pyrinomonadaceae bacterium]
MKSSIPQTRQARSNTAARPLYFVIVLTFVALVFAAGAAAKLRPFFQDGDISVTKTGPDTASANTNISYTITVSNAGADDISSATLSDNLPADTTFVSLSKPADWACTSPSVGTNGAINCMNSLVAAGSNDIFILIVHINSGTAPGTFITNIATVGSPDDVNEENNQSTAVTQLPSNNADLSITKSGPLQVKADTNATFTITVINPSTNPASNVGFTDTLPAGVPSSPMTFVSFNQNSGPSWNCGSPGTTASCSIANLPANSTSTFNFVGHVPSGTADGTQYTNQVTVTSDADPNSENNTGSAVTNVASCLTDQIVTTNADGGPGSLRQAIADACDGTTIGFDMTQVVSPITLTTGELNINKNLTINGPGANTLTVQRSTAGGTLNFRIFSINAGKTVNISGLTISNGLEFLGGGILNGDGTLNLDSSTISGNAQSGVANLATNGTATATITNSTINGNTSSASSGGGVRNFAQQSGATAILTVINSTISGNSSAFGGGIANDTAGSGMTATTTTINSTIAGNTNGGGIRNSTSGGTAITRIDNTIVAGNLDAGGPHDIAGTVEPASSFNLIGTSTDGGGLMNGVNNNKVGVANVLLGPLAFNGGPTQTIALLPASPALDAGYNALITSPPFNGPPFTDQRGFDRIVNGIVDIGAFESRGFTIVATGGTPQSTPVLTAFGQPFVATVSSAFNEPVSGGVVTFTAPSNGPSGTFPGSVTTVNTNINGSGLATAPTFTANATGGSYNVVASIGATVPTASFALTNNKLNQTITFGSIPNKIFGDADFSVSPTASSGLAVSLAATGNCTVTTPAPATVHITGAGNCTLTASQAGSGTYNAATDVQQSFTIAKAATTTTGSATPNPSNSGQNVTFTATVTSTAGTPTGTVQFKDGGTNLGSAQTINSSAVVTFSTSTLTPGVHTITADYSGDSNFAASLGTLAGGQQVGSIIRFSSASYNTTENSGSTTITVQRVGDPSQAVTVDYATPDDSSAATVLPCSTANGVASPRCDFTTALGTLRWAAGDGASKTFTVLINQDNFVEGSESLTLTLSNLTGSGAGFSTPGATTATTTLTIADDVTEPTTNPIDVTDTFVRQHYHDFLNREADPAGLTFWRDNIDKCNDSARRPAGQSVAQCIEIQRINTSAAFFLSIEFQNTGYFVERVYKAGFGDIGPPTVPAPIRFTNFMSDTQEISGGIIVGVGNWQAQIDANKNAFALEFVQRPGFLARYPGIISPTAFVDTLNANAGKVLSDSERSALISELSQNSSDPALRADVLKKVAENAVLQQREFNRAFVLMQYFGYLRRNPDAAPEPTLNFGGYNFWLNKLNQFNGDYIGAEMIKAFLNSSEYRNRFGP